MLCITVVVVVIVGRVGTVCVVVENVGPVAVVVVAAIKSSCRLFDSDIANGYLERRLEHSWSSKQ